MGDVHPFRRRAGARRPTTEDEQTPAGDPAAKLDATMSAVARGDETAFAELYDQLAPVVHGVVLRVVRNPAQAEEVTQEVFLEIWRLAARYDRTKGAPKSWCCAIAHRRAVDRVRSEQAARDREDRDHLRAPPPPGDSVEEAVAEQFLAQRVRDGLDALTDLQRSAVELAYYGGHTYREVAVLLDIAEGTAKTRIRDGLIRLRDHLGVTTT